MTRRRLFLTLGVVLLCVGSLRAQVPPATRPAGAPATRAAQAPATQPKPLQATARQVEGAAECLRSGPDQKWQPLKSGDRLDELTLIRTGFGSRVVLAFEDNSEVVVERATMMGIGEFRKVGPVTRTNVGLKYGSMRTTVSKAAGPSDFTVSTPVATLAVRGSWSNFGFGDFGMLLHVGSGDWGVHMGFHTHHCGPGEGTDSHFSMSTDLNKFHWFVPLLDTFGGLGGNEQHGQTFLGGGRGGFGLGAGGLGDWTGPGPGSSLTRPDVIVPGLDIDIGI